MNLRERLRQLEAVISSMRSPEQRIELARQCPDDPLLFEYHGQLMTAAEVKRAVGEGVMLVFMCRSDDPHY